MAKKSLGIIQKFPEDLEEQAISHINCSTAYYHLDQKAAAIEEAQEALNLYAKISKKRYSLFQCAKSPSSPSDGCRGVSTGL